MAAERDYLKQELGMFIEQTASLETEKASLLQELEEKREMEEFKSLEEACRMEHQVKLTLSAFRLLGSQDCRDSWTCFGFTVQLIKSSSHLFLCVDDFGNLQEELENEIFCLKKAAESFEVQHLELQVRSAHRVTSGGGL